MMKWMTKVNFADASGTCDLCQPTRAKHPKTTNQIDHSPKCAGASG